MKKKALMLVIAMVLGSLTGCSKPAESETKEQPASTEVQQTSEKEEEVKPEEPIKISIMVHNALRVPEGSISDKWTQQLEEKVGVEIEWICPPSSSYEDNLQLSLLNKERPDVFCFPTEWLTNISFEGAIQGDYFYNLADMIEDYPNLMAHTSDFSWEALDIYNDGSIWGVPRSTVARADGFAINEQWLKNLGIDYKEGEFMTLDEFYDLLYKFTYNDPDGNGVDDTYGLGAYANADGSLNTGIPSIFHLNGTGGWYEMPDGTYTDLDYSKDYDYAKQYLAFMNKLWTEGLMDPDAFSNNIEIFTERCENSYGVFTQYPATMDVTVTERSPATFVYCPGVVVDGDPIGEYTYGGHNTGIWYFYSISKTCEHPEKVLELMDYVLSDEQWVNLNAKNLEGVGFVIDADGNYDFSLNRELSAADKENGTQTGESTLIQCFMRRSDGAEFFIDKKLPRDQISR